LTLKIKHFRLGHQINQVGSTVEQHIGEKIGLVNLTGICTRRSDPDGDLVFHQVWKIIVRTIPGDGLFFEIPRVVCPQSTIFNEKNINIVPFFMGQFSELETPGCKIYIVLAKSVDKICHNFLPWV
jgi:hypothetical protein